MIKIHTRKIYWFLILILPFMDSINGMLNNGGNEGGISLGIIYRVCIMGIAVISYLKDDISKNSFLSLMFVVAIVSVSIVIGNSRIIEYINIIFRLLLPMIIIVSYESMSKKTEKNYCNRIFEYWSILFPLTIIVPYVLGLGFNTYGAGAAGYKGYYFAQNDIGYILAVLYLFIVMQLSEKISIKKLMILLMLLIANLMLGLKSNYLIIVIVTIGYLFFSSRRSGSRLSKMIVVVAIIVGIRIIFKIYSDDINQIITRWNYFYKNREFVSFITSARFDRVEPAFYWLKNNFGIIGILFGSGLEYTLHTVKSGSNVIEMDTFDIFFQMGVTGVLIVYGFYIRFLRRYRFKKFYFWAFMFSIIIGALAGHVFESALSGMFFAMICCGGINEYRYREAIVYEK